MEQEKHDDAQSVFILRMNIGGRHDKVGYGLEANRIVIGYARTPGLIEIADNANDHYPLRDAISEAYEWDNKVAGRKAGELWRFFRGMKPDDLVLVPHGKDIYLARVAGPPGFDESMGAAAYYREVEWLNGGVAYPRGGLDSIVQHNVGSGTRNTCREVKAILPQVREMEERRVDTDKTFQENLRERLEENAKDVLEHRNMNPKGFEYFLCELFMRRFGAIGNVRGGRGDKGADIVLDIPPPYDLLTPRVVVQAKYYVDGRKVGRTAVDDIVRGMDAEGADLGLVVTTGEFSDDAEEACEQVNADGQRVELVDGELLATMIVESGIALTKRLRTQTEE